MTVNLSVFTVDNASVPTTNCLSPLASDAAPVNLIYCVILFCPAKGIFADENPELLPVPIPKPICFRLSSVEDCQIFPSLGAPLGVPFADPS